MARPYKRTFVQEHEEPAAEAPEEQVVRKVIDRYLFVYKIWAPEEVYIYVVEEEVMVVKVGGAARALSFSLFI
jgi:hypothetical protein